jgi:hypothetical protein
VIDAFFTEQDPTPAEGTTRLADDIIGYFRKQAQDAGGGNYQTAVNQALPDRIDRQSLEDLVRGWCARN